MTKFATSETNDLKAADFKGKRLKVTISDVQERHYEARNGKPAEDKAVLAFEGKDKGLVLNKTNTKILINAYGADSGRWIGQEIGLTTHETELGEGWVVQPLNVEPPEFNDDVPF